VRWDGVSECVGGVEIQGVGECSAGLGREEACRDVEMRGLGRATERCLDYLPTPVQCPRTR
jgi:hypothetical protein